MKLIINTPINTCSGLVNTLLPTIALILPLTGCSINSFGIPSLVIMDLVMFSAKLSINPSADAPSPNSPNVNDFNNT